MPQNAATDNPGHSFLAKMTRLLISPCALRQALCALIIVGTSAVSYATDQGSEKGDDGIAGPARLVAPQNSNTDRNRIADENRPRTDAHRQSRGRYEPGEFELYVNQLLGVDIAEYSKPKALPANAPDTRPPLLIHRLGSDMMLDGATDGTEVPRAVGEDYVIGIGDELQVTLWGSVDADLRLVVDRAGRITIPRIGPVLVAGVRYGELSTVVRSRVSQVFKNFQVSTALGRLRSFRVYVTGFVHRPGPYTVSSLATLVNGLAQAGGPAAAGSFRQIELRRAGKTISRFDIYDLILRGDKSSDQALQADDVIYVGPIGAQAAILGSVNNASIVELKPGETVADVLGMAGGFGAVADRSRIAIERLSDRNDRRIAQLDLPAQSNTSVESGDVLRVFSAVGATLAQDRQFKHVVIEGEVRRPGDYLMPPGSTLLDALNAAGGLTAQAYVFGADFSRENVRKVQQENYDRALRDMETDFTRSTSTQRTSTADEAAAQSQRAASTARLIERLRNVRPTGRIVLQLEPDAAQLPSLAIEDGDRLMIPARPSTVGVFGSVFNAGSYLLTKGSTLEDVMKLAGGPKRGADPSSVFVLRANGSVVSARQTSSGWLGMSSGIDNLAALPGDTIFVPEELDKTTFMQQAKDWTQILYQFGLGAAALKTIKN